MRGDILRDCGDMTVMSPRGHWSSEMYERFYALRSWQQTHVLIAWSLVFLPPLLMWDLWRSLR